MSQNEQLAELYGGDLDHVTAVGHTVKAAYTWLVGFAAAMGGFVFGFDTGIISGAMSDLQEFFHMDARALGIAVGTVFIGAILGAVTGGILSDRFGRRRVLIGTALMFLVSAALIADAEAIWQFNLGRFVAGLGIGISMPISGVYLAEIAPASVRGRVVSLNQLAITFGILISYLVGWCFAGAGDRAWQVSTSWRWSFGSAAVPAIVFFVILRFIPESPRWLIQRGRLDEALGTLARVNGAERAHLEMEEIKQTIAAEDVSLLQLLKPGLRVALIIGIMLSLFDQITGISIVITYIQKILLDLGFSKEAAGQGMVLLGINNFVTTILALPLLDRVGRKPLLMFCPLGMCLSTLFIGFQFFSNLLPPVFVLFNIMIYCFCYALGLGPGILLVLSEIFPTHIRGKAAGVCTIFLWVSCYLFSETFPVLLEWSRAGTFWILSCTTFAMFLFVWRVIPETKGRTLEEIERSWHR